MVQDLKGAVSGIQLQGFKFLWRSMHENGGTHRIRHALDQVVGFSEVACGNGVPI